MLLLKHLLCYLGFCCVHFELSVVLHGLFESAQGLDMLLWGCIRCFNLVVLITWFIVIVLIA